MSLVSDLINKVSNESSSHMQVVSTAIQKKLLEVLEEMHEMSGEVACSVVSSADGIAWAARLPSEQDQHRFSAMGSTLLAVSDSMAQEAQKGTPRNVLVEGEDGNIYVMHAGDNLILTVVTRKGANLGLTLAHARQTADKIAGLRV